MSSTREFLAFTRPGQVPVRGTVDPARVVEAVTAALPAEAIVVNDAGDFAGWVHRYHRFRLPGTQAAPSSGAMGYAVAASLGAKLARPERPVVALVGDGGFLMTGHELVTAVQEGLAVKVVLGDNGAYGTIAMHQHKRSARTTSLRSPPEPGARTSRPSRGVRRRRLPYRPAPLRASLFGRLPALTPSGGGVESHAMRLERVDALRFRVADVRRAVGLARLPATLGRRLVVREYLVTERLLSPSTVPALPGTVRVRPVTEDDVPAACAVNPVLSVDEVHRRWREGQCWTGWWVAGTLAHWRWESAVSANLPYLGRSVRPLPGDLWIVEVFTRPDYRNRGLYNASTAHAFATAHAAGYRRVIGLVSPWNRPAMHVMLDKWRRVPVGTVREAGVPPWRRTFLRGRVRLDDTGAVFVPADPDDDPRRAVTRAEPEHRAPLG